MSHSRTPLAWVLAAGVSLALPAGLEAAPAAATVSVNCATGQTITQALKNPAEQLRIEVTGTCVENVVIERDRVDLVGVSPVAGIQAAGLGRFGAVLTLLDVTQVGIFALTLEGSNTGLRVTRSGPLVQVSGCVLRDNAFAGALVSRSSLNINGCEIHGNGSYGIWAEDASVVGCSGCTIFDNPTPGSGDAIVVVEGSDAHVDFSDLSGLRGLVVAQSRFQIYDSTVTAASLSLAMTRRSEGSALRTELAGTFFVSDGSYLELRDSPQTANLHPAGNQVRNGSTLTAFSFTTVAPILPLTLRSFAEADISLQVDVADIACLTEARAICDGSVTVGASTCGGCPVTP